MSPTVDDLRNEIRLAVDRYERVESTAFTKEALAAICEAVGYEIDQSRFPSKPQMRAGILWTIGRLDEDDPEETQRAFRKAELEAIAAALREE
jgi:RecJ-like exonuclease